MDFQHSDKVKSLQKRLNAFMDEHVYPAEAVFDAQMDAARESGNRWQPAPVIEQLKEKAKAAGLWNLFLPESKYGAGLTNLEYAPLCEIMGRSHIGAEPFNCSAPDTGNMETLARYASVEQQQQWLLPLLDGTIRSAFAMTEPEVASSDATNIEARIVRDGDRYVIDGRKWWTSGANDPRCQILIFMGKSNPDHPNRHQQQSMILVPMATPASRSCVTCRCSATTTRRTVTPKSRSRTCACPRATCCSAKGAASKSRRAGSDRGASTTACA
jgi:acyl-CoA dehydrogenase